MLISDYPHLPFVNWDTEYHKKDGELTMQRHVVPSAQVRLRIASATSLSIYSFILTYRLTAHVPLTNYIVSVCFSWVVYKFTFPSISKMGFYLCVLYRYTFRVSTHDQYNHNQNGSHGISGEHLKALLKCSC